MSAEKEVRLRLASRSSRFAREAGIAPAVPDDGLDLIVDELARSLSNQELLFAQQRIELEVIDAGEARHNGFILARARPRRI